MQYLTLEDTKEIKKRLWYTLEENLRHIAGSNILGAFILRFLTNPNRKDCLLNGKARGRLDGALCRL
jgi:hypothetical protein